ncbi:septum formation inhibitor Maf [Halobacillus fulvus]|nr:septum formation inhibitor Maf [Halobacillus fulvus]
MVTLILGSQSPRRKELLESAGFSFEVRASGADESLQEGIDPEEAVRELSGRKSETIQLEAGEVLLTADTVVALQGEILGKPVDHQEACHFLRSLSGVQHDVYTGVTIRSRKEETSFVVRTSVTFFELTDEEIEAYIATGEVWDKAGAYGIQGKGALFVERIEGDYFSVVGLPISRVVRELKNYDIFVNGSSSA